jgi:hypothetical protein
MHDIEPHHLWRDKYIASEDERSPHFGRIYDEFRFTNRVYNYYIHPQWDEFGSQTLYGKIIYADYDEGVAILELIGEWNDCLTNDILFLKQNLVDALIRQGISRYLIMMDNVLNFHGSDDCYYEEWFEDIVDERGYICLLNLLPHVLEEMRDTGIHHYVQMSEHLQIPNWRSFEPKGLIRQVEMLFSEQIKELY